MEIIEKGKEEKGETSCGQHLFGKWETQQLADLKTAGQSMIE